MQLEWEDFKSIVDLGDSNANINHQPGIYVWGWFDETGAFVPYYVGKARNLFQRFFEHLGCLQGGMYGLYSYAYCKSKNFKPLYVQDGNQLIYLPSSIENWNDVFRSENVQQNLQLILKELRFTWCKTDVKDNAELERILYQVLNKDGKVGATVKGKPRTFTTEWSFTGNEVMTALCR